MNRFLIDTNVIVDIFRPDPLWTPWSSRTLHRCEREGALCINAIIYAELAAGFERIEDLDDVLPEAEWVRLPLPWPAGFLAGRAFGDYRRRGGVRSAPLPDFYIGAHAAVDGLVLVTRDAARYRTYFPRLPIISPESTP